ncbi:MAG: hypothetical protein JSW06_04245 [Thermoplasmatales archaeon]|nr:MAG: hypothetical protein JSW06_04245 [Thermoplasmatales archaeon]
MNKYICELDKLYDFSGLTTIIKFSLSVLKAQSSLSPSLRLNWFITAAGTVVRYDLATEDAFAMVVVNPILIKYECLVEYITFTTFDTIKYHT